MSFDLQSHYLAELDKYGYQADPAQQVLVDELQRLGVDLIAAQNNQKTFAAKLLNRLGLAKPVPVEGVYAWGGVGRGKTFVMDAFFNHLPGIAKKRVHFHRFMLSVHQQLHTVKSASRPLEIVAESIASDARVLCFDELHVDDITDAMVLAGLFHALIQHGVVLVFTSNCEVDELYREGLQRQRFQSAIDLIKKHCVVLNIDHGIDYRLQTLLATDTYLQPHGDSTDQALLSLFTQLTGEAMVSMAPLQVLGRAISVRMESEGVCWFDFAEICEGFRSKADYAEISRFFHSVIISDIPILDSDSNDPARRFVELIDELYDRRVNVIVSAAAPAEQLYTGKRLAASFLRTASRLREFSNADYMAQPHRP
jgi:cell division protein ZapE